MNPAFKTWDIETTIKLHFKRKASPFTLDNWVVTHAFKSKDGKVEEYRFGDTRPAAGWLRPVLSGTRLLAGFNIKFDLLHALQDAENLEAWMDYVAGGGNVWDCQLAEYLLCGLGQKDQILSLDEVAPRYGGNVKVDEVKALWAAGVDTHLIDPELLSRYLCGGKDEHGVLQMGDIENTEKIALAQIERARGCGQLNSILLNMGSLLCTIEMERNGMFVDKPLGLELAAELKTEVDRLNTVLQGYLPADMPFQFNWNSTKQKSALVFGGTVYWDGHEYDCVSDGDPNFTSTVHKHVYDAMPADKRPKLLYAQMDVECWLFTPPAGGAVEYVPINREFLDEGHKTFVIQNCERFKGGKNAGELKTKKVKFDNLDKPKGRACKVPYTFKRITEPKRAWAGAEPGFWSTSSDVIEELAVRNIPFLKAMAELQSAVKDLGTYYITTDEDGKTKGMLTLVDEHGIIHHGINHTSTVTGRFSSSNPNLQNIPKGDKSKVKMIFVSRFGADGSIIQSDFTALEIYIQAILTKCKQLIEDLKNGLDMHVLRLSNSPAGEGKSYEELLTLCKGKAGIEPVKEWEYKRTDSKVYSFQAAYGAGDKKIAETTGMAEELVASLRAADELRYPEISAYFVERTKEIKKNRKGNGPSVPHPDLPGVFCQLGTSSVRTPDGKLYSYQEHPAPEYLVKKGIYASFSPTEIKNYEVQGGGGEWAKAAMWLAVRAFYKRRNFGGLALLVNQVHDALYSDAHKDVSLEAAALLHACMEGANELMEKTFNWIVPVPVPCETKAGPSMMAEKGIPGVQELSRKFRQELRDEYMGGYIPSFDIQLNRKSA